MLRGRNAVRLGGGTVRRWEHSSERWGPSEPAVLHASAAEGDAAGREQRAPTTRALFQIRVLEHRPPSPLSRTEHSVDRVPLLAEGSAPGMRWRST